VSEPPTITVAEALKRLGGPVRGMTSVISATIGGGDLNSISGGKADEAISLERAQEELARCFEAQKGCKSDAAWWGYMGDIAYWRTVISILKAGVLCNGFVPDLAGPDRDGVVMDVYNKMEKWGFAVLKAAEKLAAETKALTVVQETASNSNDPAAKVTLKHLTAYALNLALVEIGADIDAVQNPMAHHRAWKAAQDCFWKGIEVGLRRVARGDDLDKFLKELYETRASLQPDGGEGVT